MEIAIIDKDADYYVAQLRRFFPNLTFHAGTTASGLVAQSANVSVLIGLAHEISFELVRAMPRLVWVQALTTGVDALARLENLRHDIVVTSARGIHGPQMSEMAFLHMLALSRQFGKMLDNQRSQTWARWPQRLLLGKTAVLVGIGAISEDLARRCKAFGMRVVGVSSARRSAEGFDLVYPRHKLHEAAAQADFLIALVPYNASTHHMIDAAVLDALSPSAFVINLARGPVLDEEALIARLKAGRIAGAGLDVFEIEPLPPTSQLWRLGNVLITPHVGGMSDTYADQALPLLIENITLFEQGRLDQIRNIVQLHP